MLFIPIICYFITAVTFVFPPLAPMFEQYKSTHCTFVPRIAAVPTLNKKASPEVCKTVTIMTDLFLKASPVDVCHPVLEKGLSVVFALPPPVLPMCSAAVGVCKPDFTSGLFKPQTCRSPAFPFCPVPSPSVSLSSVFSPVGYCPFNPFSFGPAFNSFTSTVKELSQNLLLVVLKKLSVWKLIVFLTSYGYWRLFKAARSRRLRGTCPCSFCNNH